MKDITQEISSDSQQLGKPRIEARPGQIPQGCSWACQDLSVVCLPVFSRGQGRGIGGLKAVGWCRVCSEEPLNTKSS